MQSRILRRVAVIAILSILPLLSVSGDADAKASSRSKSRAAAYLGAASSLPGGYVSPDSSAGNIARGSTGAAARDNTAGWGNVGAF